jgi:23S rRNA pseudouridine1911/1915/1917 synthase
MDIHIMYWVNRMTKAYTGLVHGVFDPPAGRIDAPVGRSPHSIMERIVDWSGTGRASATRYETMQVFGKGAYSLVRFHLETGRTHQIRVHSLYAGHALVGDSLYPQVKKDDGSWLPDPVDLAMGRQALHASGTTFSHPVTGLTLDFHSGLPADMQHAIRMATSPLHSRT